MSPGPAARLGAWAESAAADFLTARGFRILARNFRTRFGEIDVIADDGRRLLLVEVKYRKNESFDSVESSLTAAKRRKWWRAGRFAAAQFGADRDIRFDFIAILGPPDRPDIRHFENVLSENGRI